MERTEHKRAANCIDRPPTKKKTRTWTLTINNPTDEEVKFIDSMMEDDTVVDLIGQHEEGESGTLHIQLMINWKNPRAFGGVKKLFPRAHIEPVRNLIGTAKYCSKEDTREELLPSWEKIGSKSLLKIWNKGTEEEQEQEQEQEGAVKRLITKGSRDPLEGLELKWWQTEILELYDTEPDNRKIYWYWRSQGPDDDYSDMTDMVTHLFYNYDDVIVATETKQAKKLVKVWCDGVKWKRSPRMIVYDITTWRRGSDKISYQDIEEMKGPVKAYKTCTYATAIPHIVVFANRPPYPQDGRWVSIDIDRRRMRKTRE